MFSSFAHQTNFNESSPYKNNKKKVKSGATFAFCCLYNCLTAQQHLRSYQKNPFLTLSFCGLRQRGPPVSCRPGDVLAVIAAGLPAHYSGSRAPLYRAANSAHWLPIRRPHAPGPGMAVSATFGPLLMGDQLLLELKVNYSIRLVKI